MDNLDERIILTIELLSRKLIVPSIDEVYSYLILQGYEAKVTKNDFRVIIDNLSLGQKIVINEEYIALADHDLKKDIENRRRKEIEIEGKISNLQSYLKTLKNIFGFNLLLLKKNYNENKFELIYISPKFKFKKLFNLLLKISNISLIENGLNEYELEERKDRSVINGLDILNCNFILNENNTYETLLDKNKWIFEIFKNFEVKNISTSFRIDEK